MGTVFVDNLEPQSGTTLTLGASGDTVGLATGASQTLAVSTPAFEAYQSANTNISDAVDTKVLCNTEVFDTDNCYDNSTNYRFTPTTAGKYFVYGVLQGYGGQVSGIEALDAKIFKNGTRYRQQSHNFTSNRAYVVFTSIFAVVDMNGSSDYVELYASFNTDGTPRLNGSASGDHCYFGAYRIIGA